MHELSSLAGMLDHGFESDSKHGFLCEFILCLCLAATLRWADHSPKESYCPCKKDYETELITPWSIIILGNNAITF
jgi:hypothetical protein